MGREDIGVLRTEPGAHIGLISARRDAGGFQGPVEPLEFRGDRVGRDQPRRQAKPAGVEHDHRADRDSRTDSLPFQDLHGQRGGVRRQFAANGGGRRWLGR